MKGNRINMYYSTKSLEDKLEDILNNIKSRDNRIKYLEEENARLKSEQYKDEELQKMKSRLDKMQHEYYQGFPITDEEKKKIDEFIDAHSKKVPHMKIGRIGCSFEYRFINTALGTSGTIIASNGDELEFQEIG